MSDTNHVFGIAGLPGAGKSTVAEHIKTVLTAYDERAVTQEMSEWVRKQFEDSAGDKSVNDNELGRWAADQKDERGDGCFARDLAHSLNRSNRPHVAISGLRSPEEAEALRDVFGAENVTIIAIWTLPDIRFERKYDTPPRTDHPEWDTFEERNERETGKWGCDEFFYANGPSDYIVGNNAENSGNLDEKVSEIATYEALGFDSGVAETWTHPLRQMGDEKVLQYL